LQFDPNAPSGAFSIAYSAASKTYTLSSGTITQSFGSGDLSASSTTTSSLLPDEFAFYNKSTGSLKNQLLLTKAGGASQTRYVGGGAWWYFDGTANDHVNAFSYGFATADGSTPRTGSANFSIRAFGALELGSEVLPLIGEGNLSADFASGSVAVNGVLRSIAGDGKTLSGAYLVDGSATVSSTANSFTGTMHSSYSGGDLSGQLNGKLYGPNAEEVGGAFSLVDNNNFFGVGEFIGGKGTLTAYLTNDANAGVRNLASFRNFDVDARVLPTSGVPADFSLSTSLETVPVTISYDPAVGYSVGGPLGTVTYPASTKVSGQPPSVDVYMVGVDNMFSVGNPRGDDPTLNLTYAGFANWVSPASGATQQVQIIYGDLTAPSQIPVSGSGTYVGQAGALAAFQDVAYLLSGAVHFNVDFASYKFTGDMSLTGNTLSASSLPPLSVSLSVANGALTRGTPLWSGSLTSSSSTVGSINGRFYGPGAAEMAGFWSASVNQGSGSIDMFGSIAAKK